MMHSKGDQDHATFVLVVFTPFTWECWALCSLSVCEAGPG
jgi:hypothetical protein